MTKRTSPLLATGIIFHRIVADSSRFKLFFFVISVQECGSLQCLVLCRNDYEFVSPECL